MQGLIRLQQDAGTDMRPHDFVDWIRVPPPEDPPRTREQEIDREALTETQLPPSARPELTGDPIRVSPAHYPGPGELATVPQGIATPDGPLISIVRVQPVYPPAAVQRGLEGWVDVRFDVMPNGLAANIVAVASSNRVFEKAAIEAAQRFRFKAPVVNGTPQSAYGVEYRFRFTMDD